MFISRSERGIFSWIDIIDILSTKIIKNIYNIVAQKTFLDA